MSRSNKKMFLFLFCYVCFVAGVGQVYFILSLFNSVPTNNYVQLYYRERKLMKKCNNRHLQQAKLFSNLNKAYLAQGYMLSFHSHCIFMLFTCILFKFQHVTYCNTILSLQKPTIYFGSELENVRDLANISA